MKMAKTVGQLEILHERRLVELPDGSLGYFHCWEHYSRPIDPSPFIGGSPGGTIRECFALIEKANGFVDRFAAGGFRFVDGEHEILKEMDSIKAKRRS